MPGIASQYIAWRYNASQVARLLSILSLFLATLAMATLVLILYGLWRPFRLPHTLVTDGMVIVEWPAIETAAKGEPLVDISGSCGVYYLHRRVPQNATASTQVLPNLLTVYLFSPLLFFSALPVVVYSRRFHRWYRMRERLAAGRCTTCGYDLRASPDRCPECGAVRYGAKVTSTRALPFDSNSPKRRIGIDA